MSTVRKLIQKIEVAIRDEYNSEAKRIAIHDAIASLIKERWEGKKITKLFATALSARLGHQAYLTSTVGMAQIEVWGAGSPFPLFGDRVSFYLGSDRHGGMANLETFEQTDKCHGKAAKDRQNRRLEILRNPLMIEELALAGAQYQAASSRIKSLLEFGGDFEPDRYTLEKIVEGEGA